MVAKLILTYNENINDYWKKHFNKLILYVVDNGVWKMCISHIL